MICKKSQERICRINAFWMGKFEEENRSFFPESSEHSNSNTFESKSKESKQKQKQKIRTIKGLLFPVSNFTICYISNECINNIKQNI